MRRFTAKKIMVLTNAPRSSEVGFLKLSNIILKFPNPHFVPSIVTFLNAIKIELKFTYNQKTRK